MPEAPLDLARTWVEFTDPDNPRQRFRCDLTWLTSRWTCVFGTPACRGLYAGRPDDGCCTLGAHFTEKADYQRVRDAASALTADEWQFRHLAYAGGSLSQRNWTEREDDARKTKVVEGACIFLNRPGFAAGPGCALHQRAVKDGTKPHEVKPEVCWQLPIRRSYRTVELQDGTSYLEISITEFDRRGWGPGGHDLDWFCSGSSDAHVGLEPVFRSNRDELVELMGEAAYDQLVVRCTAYLRSVNSARRGSGRELLPLLVHPATLMAESRRRLRRKPLTVKGNTMDADGAIRSPNIWNSPEIYELENRALDRAGLIDATMLALAGRSDWTGATVLDIGCGAGFHLPRLAESAEAVIGVEPHAPLVALAQDRTAGLDNVSVRLASAQATGLPSESVDVATARWAYFFGPGCEPGLVELTRIMRPGGLAFFVDVDATRSTFGAWFRGSLPDYDPAAVERFWRRQGWVQERLEVAWEVSTRSDFEAVVRLEFAPTYAGRILAEDPDRTGVDYAVNLWWRRF